MKRLPWFPNEPRESPGMKKRLYAPGISKYVSSAALSTALSAVSAAAKSLPSLGYWVGWPGDPDEPSNKQNRSWPQSHLCGRLLPINLGHGKERRRTTDWTGEPKRHWGWVQRSTNGFYLQVLSLWIGRLVTIDCSHTIRLGRLGEVIWIAIDTMRGRFADRNELYSAPEKKKSGETFDLGWGGIGVALL